MAHAYVMVRTEAGAPQDVWAALSDAEPVSEAHVVAGDYDLIVEVDAPTASEILDVTTEEIQALEGVTDTKTYVAMSQ
ncbi:MAG: Lrp/AsnC family transcriptional regulator [Halodesulfurarchaeum sp.]